MTVFISTAIPFVNAEPHLGFAYELVLGDILARHRRRRGHDVWFQTGTDDHSLKNVAAAARAGLPIRDFVERNSEAFRALDLELTPDEFISTSRDPRHRPVVEELWGRCRDDLYQRSYRGLYCAGCEAFVDDDALCPEHGTSPEVVEETNWFFRLSRYREQLRELLPRITSEAALAETLAFLDGDVRDLSVSRDIRRANGWGIPVPGDPTQVIYVWFDALANYLSTGQWNRHERIHVIGKGITRFHAVYWIAFLLSAGLPLPTKIAVHGYLTVDGAKISKSVNPVPIGPVIERWGVDALRWQFARFRAHADSDIALGCLGDAYDRDLADRLGNLVQRTSTLIAKHGGAIPPRSHELRAIAEALPARVDRALEALHPDEATTAIIELLDAANRHLEITAPWKLERDAALAALYAPLEAARFAAGELEPFVPGVARLIAERLDADLSTTWGTLEPGRQLRVGAPPLPRKSLHARARLL